MLIHFCYSNNTGMLFRERNNILIAHADSISMNSDFSKELGAHSRGRTIVFPPFPFAMSIPSSSFRARGKTADYN